LSFLLFRAVPRRKNFVRAGGFIGFILRPHIIDNSTCPSFTLSLSLFHSLTLSLFHSFTLSLTHSLSLTLSLFHSLVLSLFHSFTHSLTLTLTLPLFHSLFHSLSHSFSHSLTLSLTLSLSHSFTHPLTPLSLSLNVSLSHSQHSLSSKHLYCYLIGQSLIFCIFFFLIVISFQKFILSFVEQSNF
jgi:hypothetical protein